MPSPIPRIPGDSAASSALTEATARVREAADSESGGGDEGSEPPSPTEPMRDEGVETVRDIFALENSEESSSRRREDSTNACSQESFSYSTCLPLTLTCRSHPVTASTPLRSA